MSLPQIIVDVTGRAWSRCENSSCPALEHPEDLHSHEVQIVKPKPLDKYLKEDPERAEAVLETIFRALKWPVVDQARRMDDHDLSEALFKHKPFLMDVFRAVRGEK